MNAYPIQKENECCPRCECHCPLGQQIVKDCECVERETNTIVNGKQQISNKQKYPPEVHSSNILLPGSDPIAKPTKGRCCFRIYSKIR